MAIKEFRFGLQINSHIDIWIKITKLLATSLELLHLMKLLGIWDGPLEQIH